MRAPLIAVKIITTKRRTSRRILVTGRLKLKWRLGTEKLVRFIG
jgi:hypothetical protein